MCKQIRVLQAYNQFMPAMFRNFIGNHSFVLHSYPVYFSIPVDLDQHKF